MEFPDLMGREACTTKRALVLNQVLDAPVRGQAMLHWDLGCGG